MTNKYPRVGEKHSKKPGGLCKICNLPKSDYSISIEINHFRGDDIVLAVHKSCAKKLSSIELIKLND